MVILNMNYGIDYIGYKIINYMKEINMEINEMFRIKIDNYLTKETIYTKLDDFLYENLYKEIIFQLKIELNNELFWELKIYERD
jgi:hypothetical protein